MSTRAALHGLSFVCALLFGPAIAYLPQTEIQALQDLYQSLNGAHWSCPWQNGPWNLSELANNDSDHMLYWWNFCGLDFGQKSADDQYLQTVTSLYFDSNHLNGTISDSSITMLPSLTAVWISNEPLLRGNFPNICSLTKLVSLEIEDTNMKGTIPLCVGNLSTINNFIIRSPNEDVIIGDGALIFNDSIIEMWCANGNNMTALELTNIDYRFVCYFSFDRK